MQNAGSGQRVVMAHRFPLASSADGRQDAKDGLKLGAATNDGRK